MTKKTNKQAESENLPEKQDKPKLPAVAITKDGFLCKTMDEAWRFAQFLSASQFVPATYQGKPHDCLIAIDMAQRLRIAPLMFLQNTYIVYGRPGMEAKLVTTLINQSGLFKDPLDYEVEGEDPKAKDYRVRAVATRAATGKVLYGPWITWDLVEAEGWKAKQGSKWQTMAEVMFHYRAASWFANRHCPEVKMGMMTADELEDIGPKHVESHTLEDTNGTRRPFGFSPSEQAEQSAKEPASDDAESEADDRSDVVGEDGSMDAPPPAPQEEAPTEPGLYTCTSCGWAGDQTAEHGKCPACGALKEKVAATEDLEAQEEAVWVCEPKGHTFPKPTKGGLCPKCLTKDIKKKPKAA